VKNIFYTSAIVLFVLFLGYTFGSLQTEIISGDLIIYLNAQSLYFNQLNPYNQENLLVELRKYIPNAEFSNFVWSPPILFFWPGILFLQNHEILHKIWPYLTTTACVLLALVGWNLKKESKFNLVYFISSCAICVAVVGEVYIMQIATLVHLPIAIGYYLFFRNRYFLSGLLFSLAIIKPHNFLFPALLILFWIFYHRKFQVLFGSLFGLFLGITITEYFYPGISYLWITKETWPGSHMGITVPSIIRGLSMQNGFKDPRFLIWFLPLCTATLLFIKFYNKILEINSNVLIYAIIINSIFTPYGFYFDQSILIFVQAFIVSSYYNSKNYELNKLIKLIIVLIAINLIPLAIKIDWLLSGTDIATILYPIGLLFLFGYFCKTHISPLECKDL
jgi:hypothetical protein